MIKLLESFLFRQNRPSVADREMAYLNAAVSRIDLERREREVENGLFRRLAFVR